MQTKISYKQIDTYSERRRIVFLQEKRLTPLNQQVTQFAMKGGQIIRDIGSHKTTPGYQIQPRQTNELNIQS